jgi:hypothetical protein
MGLGGSKWYLEEDKDTLLRVLVLWVFYGSINKICRHFQQLPNDTVFVLAFWLRYTVMKFWVEIGSGVQIYRGHDRRQNPLSLMYFIIFRTWYLRMLQFVQ